MAPSKQKVKNSSNSMKSSGRKVKKPNIQSTQNYVLNSVSQAKSRARNNVAQRVREMRKRKKLEANSKGAKPSGAKKK